MSEMKNIPLSEALFNYTMYYRRLGISGERNINNPEWISFVEKINIQDPVDIFYDLYTKRKLEAGEEKHSRFGDFNYEIEGEEVHIHFSPNQKAEIGSLKKEVVPNRIKELTEMFQEIKEKYPNAKTVNGSSWLYNFESYKRLFPHEYSQNTEISKLCLQGGSGWGQFVRANGELNEERIEEFYKNLEKLDPGKPWEVFPLQALKVKAPIERFYEFYQLLI